MTKNIDSDPDINQLQFILYQYARQGSIDRKVGPCRTTDLVHESVDPSYQGLSYRRKNETSKIRFR